MKPGIIVLMHIPASQLSSVKEKVAKLDDSYPPIFVCDVSMKKIISANSMNVSSIKIQNLSVYPNPAYDQLWINHTSKTKIQIFDLTGNLHLEDIETTNSIDISNLKRGIYIVKLWDDNGTATQKLIKK